MLFINTAFFICLSLVFYILFSFPPLSSRIRQNKYYNRIPAFSNILKLYVAIIKFQLQDHVERLFGPEQK